MIPTAMFLTSTYVPSDAALPQETEPVEITSQTSNTLFGNDTEGKLDSQDCCNSHWLCGSVAGDVELLSEEVSFVGPEEPGGHNLKLTVFNTRFVGDGLQGNGYHVFQEFVAPDGSATSQGGAKFVGNLAGRSGTFILKSSGTSDPNYAIDSDWCVVTGTGTEGLTGIAGCGKVTTDGQPVAHYTFNYKMPRS